MVLEPRCVYLVMDRCSGGDLFDTIGRFGGCLPEFEAARVGHQLLSALRYLHDDVHIAHLDIKLANILYDHIGENSDVKLIDFGSYAINLHFYCSDLVLINGNRSSSPSFDRREGNGKGRHDIVYGAGESPATSFRSQCGYVVPW